MDAAVDINIVSFSTNIDHIFLNGSVCHSWQHVLSREFLHLEIKRCDAGGSRERRCGEGYHGTGGGYSTLGQVTWKWTEVSSSSTFW
jgi:hypothetical protein